MFSELNYLAKCSVSGIRSLYIDMKNNTFIESANDRIYSSWDHPDLANVQNVNGKNIASVAYLPGLSDTEILKIYHKKWALADHAFLMMQSTCFLNRDQSYYQTDLLHLGIQHHPLASLVS